MTPRSPQDGPGPAPVFPQPVPSFAGRRAELDRMLAHVDRDPLFFIYGVGGIGKSELAYQLIREVRARPRWAEATPILVETRPGATAPRILAQLLAAVGAAPAPRRGEPTEEAHLSEQLAQLAHALDARPFLLLIDDVHNLPPEAVAQALEYLARRVRASRLVVASRREVPLPPGAPPPVVTTLGPLDPDAAAQLVAALADRLQLPPPEPAAMMRATHGSPFLIHRMLVRHAPDADSLDESLAALPPAARRVLLAAAIAERRPSVDAIRQVWAGDAALDQILRDLEQRFVLERKQGRLIVHDLIRESLVRAAAPDELAAAHGDAAELSLAAPGPGDDPPLLGVVDAVGHYLEAARPDAAWALVERWHSRLAAAGSEHLLLEPLDRLRAQLAPRRTAIDLLIARCLVRASLFEEAGRVLARVGGELSDEDAGRYDVLAGELAQQAGELGRAEALFERAVARAPDPDARFLARLRVAGVAAFTDDGARARRVLAAALAELPSPTPRQRVRARLAAMVSWMFEEHFEQATEEAAHARRELAGAGLDDLANQVAMLETLAWIECEDMDRARAAARRIDEAGLRRRVASLYRAIVRYADGEARAASRDLLEAHAHMRSHGDLFNEYLAGYYGSAALAELGELGRALALAEQTSRLAERAGLRGPAARARAQQALLAGESVQSGLAHRLADQALAGGHGGPRARARAHCGHARAFTIEGEVARALEHVAHARDAVAGDGLAAARAAIDLEHAAIDLVGGNLDRAVAHAERAIEHFRGRSRNYEAARARLVLAAAHLARGRPTDVVLAGRTIEEARERAELGDLRSVQVGCAILSAALARRSNRTRAAREVLVEALRELDPERGSLYAGALLAALDGEAAARAVPGVVALLANLGFSEAVDSYLVDRRGRRAATDGDVTRARDLHELFVDETRAVIVGQRGEVEVRGRPMLCALLSVLVQARGEPVAPGALYRQVWGVDEYHPLQHRNTLYVAINRLRRCLREVLPARDVIERASHGWRLVDDVDACVAVASRRSPDKTM